VLHAAAFGLQAIDAITLDFHDLDTLRRETRQGLELGYAGKQVIHPNQVGPVQEIYTPTAAEIAHAQALVAAFAAHQAQGSGEFAIDGKLVDLPVIKAAENVLRRASGVK
jgi:citrate lyase beta subunit